MKFEQAQEPTDIIWKNQKSGFLYCKEAFLFIFIVFLLILSGGVLFIVQKYKLSIDNKYSDKMC